MKKLLIPGLIFLSSIGFNGAGAEPEMGIRKKGIESHMAFKEIEEHKRIDPHEKKEMILEVLQGGTEDIKRSFGDRGENISFEGVRYISFQKHGVMFGLDSKERILVVRPVGEKFTFFGVNKNDTMGDVMSRIGLGKMIVDTTEDRGGFAIQYQRAGYNMRVRFQMGLVDDVLITPSRGENYGINMAQLAPETDEEILEKSKDDVQEDKVVGMLGKSIDYIGKNLGIYERREVNSPGFRGLQAYDFIDNGMLYWGAKNQGKITGVTFYENSFRGIKRGSTKSDVREILGEGIITGFWDGMNRMDYKIQVDGNRYICQIFFDTEESRVCYLNIVI